MADFLFIESRDPVADLGLSQQLGLLADLARQQHRVELYLIQQAVLLSGKRMAHAGLDALLAQGVPVHADDFSLQQRGIAAADVKVGCQVSPLARIISALEEEWRVIWN